MGCGGSKPSDGGAEAGSAAGGNGGTESAASNIQKAGTSDFKLVYDAKNDDIKTKILKIVQNVYGGGSVKYSEKAEEVVAKCEKDPAIRCLPVRMSKTQYSLSDDAEKLGAPKGFKINVKDLYVSDGAYDVVEGVEQPVGLRSTSSSSETGGEDSCKTWKGYCEVKSIKFLKWDKLEFKIEADGGYYLPHPGDSSCLVSLHGGALTYDSVHSYIKPSVAKSYEGTLVYSFTESCKMMTELKFTYAGGNTVTIKVDPESLPHNLDSKEVKLAQAMQAKCWTKFTDTDGQQKWFNESSRSTLLCKPWCVETTLEEAKLWTEHTGKNGRIFFYNKTTKESVWEKPVAISVAEKALCQQDEGFHRSDGKSMAGAGFGDDSQESTIGAMRIVVDLAPVTDTDDEDDEDDEDDKDNKSSRLVQSMKDLWNSREIPLTAKQKDEKDAEERQQQPNHILHLTVINMR